MPIQKPKDLAEMILMDLRHHCAEDPETGAYLMRSDGRRKAGRKRRYWYRYPGMLNAKVLYADSDDDAIEQIEGEPPTEGGDDNDIRTTGTRPPVQ